MSTSLTGRTIDFQLGPFGHAGLAPAVLAPEGRGLAGHQRAELRQRGDILRVTFDSMDHGVVMFDDESRLTSWNPRISVRTGSDSAIVLHSIWATESEMG